MKIVLATPSNGRIETAEVPCPSVAPGTVLVRTECSVISSGTDRMLIKFGRSSIVGKTLQQPDKVRQVLEKARTDGVAATFNAVSSKLDQPMALGYSCAGTVIEVGKGIQGLRVGDMVAGNGSHASVARIPQNLCAKVPNGVTAEEAAFATMGGIGLQGIRLLDPTIGECFVVTGLGLIGLICVQILRANGCRVLGVDYDPAKLSAARQFGAEVVDLSSGEDAASAARSFSRGRGVDGVLVCAASKASEIMNEAAEMCRVRGRVIQVGVTGLHLVREAFFRKEIRLQVSNSTGPGKGDPAYEQQGHDYPVGFVRWTEQRNFEAVLDMMADRRLDMKPLISHRFSITEAARAYEVVTGSEPSLGILLEYPNLAERPEDTLRERTVHVNAPETSGSNRAIVGFIGAGNYATAVLIPAFKAAGAELRTVASSAGVSGLYAGRKFGFAETTTDTDILFADPNVHTIVVTTRHDSHARLVMQSLRACKNVFVEKPLCLTLDELSEIEALYASIVERGIPPRVMIGFNRRFAPQVKKIKDLLTGVTGPKAFVMTVNAGSLPPDHWAQDPTVGGGRIIGEGCHFVDLLRFLAGVSITGYHIVTLDSGAQDTVSIQLTFADGSIGTVHYFSNASKTFPKERLEVFACGRVLQLDNYRRLTGFGWPEFKSMNLWRQDKGQSACAAAYVDAVVNGKPTPIPFDEILEVSRVSIQIAAR
jgi:predicted dehydrogenase/threonine dehydrogenase-like Zn-dependent dehydrogenase